MKIIIFGGTTEGRELSVRLASEGADVTVSVFSEYGAEEQDSSFGIKIEEGPKDEDAMRLMIRGAGLCVDATHPYAVIASDNIRAAAEAEGVELLRLKRTAVSLEDISVNAASDMIIAKDAADAARIAAGLGGRVLLTTGSKDIGIYAEAIDPQLLYPRVLPLVQSITACEQADIPHRNIIAVQGPFSEDFNKAVIREYEIDTVITKESGKAGGFMEKISACSACGVPAIVIARPEDEGLSFDEVLGICMEKMK